MRPLIYQCVEVVALPGDTTCMILVLCRSDCGLTSSCTGCLLCMISLWHGID